MKIKCAGTAIEKYEEPNRMTMECLTIADFRESLCGPSPEYVAKMCHPVPDAPVVNREDFILARCQGKVVLDIGASGPMHEGIVEVSKRCYGIDRPVRSDVLLGHDTFGIDLDDRDCDLPILRDVELMVCGEVIEHLSNPGWFLDRLRKAYPRIPVIVTVPNAFSDIGRAALLKGPENCNGDHIAWHSHRTIKTLLSRHGYEIREFLWYRGRPKFSEGLIVVTE